MSALRVTALLFAGALAGSSCVSDVPAANKTPPAPQLPPQFYADPPFGVGFVCITIGCDTEKSLVISNKGGGALGISKVRLTVDASTDFHLARKDGGALPSPDHIVTLKGGETLELVVRYVPTDAVVDAGAVEMEHFDAAKAYLDSTPHTDQVPLTARSLGSPAATLPSTTLDFGYVPVGSVARLDLIVSNTGDHEVLSVGPMTREDGTPAAFHPPAPRDWGTHYANPGAATHLPVMFSPTSADAFFGAVVILTNDPGTPGVRIPVQGTSIAGARLSVQDPAGDLDMPPMRSGESRTRPVVVQNLGGAPLDVTAAITAGAELGLSLDVSSATAIAPLATATFNVTLQGQAGGAVEGTLTLTDAAGTAKNVAIHGTVDAPHLLVEPGNLQFGSIVQGWIATPQAIQLSNDGFGDLTLSGVSFDVGSSSEITLVDVPTLPLKLSPGQPPVTVTVLLTATNIGPADAVLLASSDALENPVARVPIHGDVVTCDQGCPTINGVPDCSSGSCQIGSCNQGFHDADINPVNGCECQEDVIGNVVGDIPQACPGLSLPDIHDGNNGGPTNMTRAGTLHSQQDVDLYFFRARDDGCSFLFFCSDQYGTDVTLTGPNGMQLCVNYQGGGSGCGGLPTNCQTINGGPVTIRGNGQSGIFGSSDNSEDVTVFVSWAPGAQPQCGHYSLFMRADGNF